MIIASDSTEPIYVPVTATNPDGSSYDPTGDIVQLGFLADGGDVADTDWHDATWVEGTAVATVLVGPANGGVTLDFGTYRIRAKVTDDPAVPAVHAGWLTII